MVGLILAVNGAKGEPVSPRFFEALAVVESNNDDWAIGDKHLRQRAYGALQIRQPICDDYNRHHQTRHRAADLRGRRATAEKIARWYLIHYANRRTLGRAPTFADYARIWNGGPDGWKQKGTEKYWGKVKRVLADKKKKGGRR